MTPATPNQAPATLVVPTFSGVEVAAAFCVATLIQSAFFVLLVAAGKSELEVAAKEVQVARELPISVKPVLDDAPLLKLGGKKVRPKLPEKWKKLAPIPIQRFEDKSAPSPKAPDTPEAAPTSPLATGDAAAPPPDAEVAKQVDVPLTDLDAAVAQKDPDLEGPGSPDGVKEGTEADPLKARAVSLYRVKIIGWFNARFKVPVGQIPCDQLKKLSSKVVASVSSDGTVTGFSVTSASGNSIFDGRVQSAMQGSVGQQVPPPPPMYPEVLPPSISLNFTGSSQKCE